MSRKSRERVSESSRPFGPPGQARPLLVRSEVPEARASPVLALLRVEILPGVFQLELPMPFELRHVNVYLVRDGNSFTLVDLPNAGTTQLAVTPYLAISMATMVVNPAIAALAAP